MKEELIPQHPTEPLLEAMIHQNHENANHHSNMLESLLVHATDNTPLPLLEAQVIQAEKNTKKIVDAIQNPPKMDMSCMTDELVAIKKGANEIVSAIRSIKPSKDLDISGVEALLKKILDKESIVEPTDVSELKTIVGLLNDIKLVLEAPIENDSEDTTPEEKLLPALENLQNMLVTLNESVSNINLPKFDYKKLGEIIKQGQGNTFLGSGSSGSVEIKNRAQVQINPATEEKQDAMISALGGGTYITRIATDSGVSTTTYIGNAVPTSATSAAVWQITRLQSSSGLQTTYADGNALYDNVWNNRESLSYS